jgi:hypothetical protein
VSQIEIPDLQPLAGPTIQDRLMGVLEILQPQEPVNVHYPKRPTEFIEEILGITLWSKQREIAEAVWDNRYTSVASCHGIGKSLLSAALAIAFLHAHENSLVLSTAPTGRQVEAVLWRNIRGLYARSKRPLLGRPPLTTRYDISDNWYGMGFKPTDSETDPTQGFHADNVLVIIDEGAGVPKPLIDGLHAAMTTEGSRLLMIGNPTSTSGPFYDSHHGKAHNYKTFNVSWTDTPNFKAGRTILSYLITQMWVDEMTERYGEESAFIQSRVYAHWVSPEDVLIPLALIETAQERTWEDLVHFTADDSAKQAGLDVARSGTDKSVLTIRNGPFVLGQWEIPGRESWETAIRTLEKIGEEQPETTQIKIDVIGLGVGVFDVMKHLLKDSVHSRGLRMTPIEVNVSKKPWDPEKYRNQRDESYGLLAGRFRLGEIGGAIHSGSVADLSDLRYKFDGRHTQPVIEPKEDFRKRTGHSPDYGDSLALCFYNPPPDEDIPIGALVFGYAKQNWGQI